MDQAIAVVDIGKTRSKLSLWAADGTPLRQFDRVNAIGVQQPRQLDLEGIATWLKNALAEASQLAEITAIVPVGHGAAGVLMAGDTAICALDYEAGPPREIAKAYDRLRDPFEVTLSPRLDGGLNLGAQLYWLERLYPEAWPKSARFLLWPQYWAWWLSGEWASEVTSLGCHTDLWRPRASSFSDLAVSRGWAEQLAPLRGAGEVLGQVRPALAGELGLPRGCRVYCGLHDSNAALHAARGFDELADHPFAVVSTGTWFICFAAGGAGPLAYDPTKDMLANVDVAGRPTPTARFMGGRDFEAWMGGALGAASDPALLGEAAALTDWSRAPGALRATRAALELARRADRALRLVAAEGPILIEGRFAEDAAFAVALARLSPGQAVYRGASHDGVALGALRLAAPHLRPNSPLNSVGAAP
ncbi:MAG TPA: FGGY family carbohydrate kinase [Caulobacteraceae bacterium]|nr:FGGY family carbohydrate kinase [Caulobacteraceae bacterium]